MPRTCLNCKYKTMVKEKRPCLRCYSYSKHVFIKITQDKILGNVSTKSVNMFVPWQ